MTRIWWAATVAVFASAAQAELRDEAVVIDPEQLWIEVNETFELMWLGPNLSERTQVLSGADIEIVTLATDPDSAAILGVRALVAVTPGTHSCENLGDPQEYYVVALDPALATDGPLTTCEEMTVSITSGMITLEAAPMSDEGAFYAWAPGKGFSN